ncbi:MAG: response regulator transcription factor [Myxococcales bacterium]|nr:response regulator transcription factor [Myxococcales bacterium]
MTSPRDILIVEDDEAIATGLSLNLRLAGHRPTVARDGDEALAQVAARDFDMVLLDINLPRKNGLEVLQSVRDSDNLVPVIVVSARDSETDKVAALRLGADDYVTKPFALAELLARIDAVLRRTQPVTADAGPDGAGDLVATPAGDALRFGDVVIDLAQRTVTRGDEPVKLTHLEFELLVYFVRHPSHVFARGRLLAQVWGQSAGSPRTVDNFVGQLRKRFEEDPENPRHFVTVRGSGYRFDP